MNQNYDNRVRLYPDGRYRWVHEVNLYTNPTILFDVYKVFGVSILIMIVMFFFIALFSGDLDLDAFATIGKIAGIVAAIFAVLGLIGYYIFALISGGKYLVLFIMDETGVIHQQMPKEVKKGQVIGALQTLMALAGGTNPGIGILAATHTSLSSDFSHVLSVTAQRRYNMIKVNELLTKNRVYVNDQDFDGVFRFIASRCPKAKVKG